MLTRDINFINFCIEESRNVTPVSGAQIFACIAKKNTILSVGHCSLRTNPFQKNFSKNDSAIHFHAENMAIWKAINSRNKINPHENNLKGTTLYLARTYKNGKQALVTPCCGCMQAIIHFGIKRVIHTTDDGIEEL